MKDDILLREQHLEEKIRLFEQHPHEREEPVSYSNSRSPHNSVGYKRKNESILHQTPPPMNSKFQSLENSGEMTSSQNKRRRSRSNSHLEQMTPQSNTNDMTNSNEEYPRQELNEGIGLQQHHESSQESMTSSSQKRKRSRGKSPVPLPLDSLQSLPKSPNPKKQPPPKKVFIGFEEWITSDIPFFYNATLWIRLLRIN